MWKRWLKVATLATQDLPGPELCSLCDRGPEEAGHLVRGYQSRICGECIRLATRLIQGVPRRTCPNGLSLLEQQREGCTFCGGPSTPGRLIARTANQKAICADCLSLAEDVLEEQARA